MRRASQIAVGILWVLAAVGCSWMNRTEDSRKEKEKPKAPPPLHLGAVHQVYPAQKFALLRIIGPVPQPGTTVITHPADGSTTRIGNLEVSENTSPRNGMIVADIRAGTVASGDRVFLYRDVLPPKPKEALPESLVKQPESTSVPAAERGLRPPGSGPLPAGSSDPAPTAESGVEVTAPPASRPTPPASSEPASVPAPPSAPSAAPGYLDDIPDNINEWN